MKNNDITKREGKSLFSMAVQGYVNSIIYLMILKEELNKTKKGDGK